jgi:hypothetical protein
MRDLKGLRSLPLIAGALLLVQAGVLMALGRSILLPVSFGPIELVQVDAVAGVIVLLVLAGLARLVGSGQGARWIEFSLTSSITVFLVAQLNGVSDIGALVLIYAATTGMVLFAVLQDRVLVSRGHPLLPLCFAAALGIVPWGVIAFYQIGASLTGPGPAVMVRLITLVMLVSAAAFFVSQWREARRQRGGERMHVLLSFASASAFAWLVVLGLG